MNQNEFGAKVRQLREEIGVTREEFCSTEEELTVRQLMRIEAGDSKPTLTTMQFIASRLGMTLFQLMPDYVELPKEYKRLKYDVIRVPTYQKQSAIESRDERMNQVYDEYYDYLPKDEQLATDVLRSLFDIQDTESAIYGQDILEEYFEKSFTKDVYGVTDLLLIRLFVVCFRYQSVHDNSENIDIFMKLPQKLIQQVDVLSSDELFVLRDLIFALIGTAGDKKIYDDIPDLIACLEKIMNRTQDFQKMPILKLVTWKHQLLVCKDKQQAEIAYKQAIVFAQMLNDNYLIEKLEKEWIEDTEL